jgi:glycosyltransferase involved in cell wall biosynthesis
MNLSVVIATYDRHALLRRLLSQLSAQTADTFEVVVVDDGSTPAVALDDLETPYPLRLIRQQNGGAASARHAGVLAARAPIVLFVDDDMQIGPDFVEQHLAGHHCGSGVVLGRIKADPALPSMPLFERWHSRMLDRKAEGIRDGSLPLRGNLFFTGNVSLRRDDYLKVGGFDASLRQSEDIELGLRLEKAGVAFQFREAAWTMHGSDRRSLASWRARSHRYGICDHRIARKHPESRHASPWRFLFDLHPLARPLLALSVSAPRLGALAAPAAYAAASLADRLGFEGAAMAGTTLAYMIDYFRGVRSAAGSLAQTVSEVREFMARFERDRVELPEPQPRAAA